MKTRARGAGASATIAPLEVCSGQKAGVDIGKPGPMLLDILAETQVSLRRSGPCSHFSLSLNASFGQGMDKRRTVMVGDRLETDVLFGTRAPPAALACSRAHQSRPDSKRVQDARRGAVLSRHLCVFRMCVFFASLAARRSPQHAGGGAQGARAESTRYWSCRAALTVRARSGRAARCGRTSAWTRWAISHRFSSLRLRPACEPR